MASILKSGNFIEGMNTAQTEVFNWEDVAGRAKQYLQTVREQAHSILSEAKNEAVRIREQASASGVAEGQHIVEEKANKLANRLASEQVSKAMQTIDELGRQLEEATRKWLRQWQHETIPLAIAIAEKLVSRQVDVDSDILMHWIEETIRMSHGSRKLRLRMNPRDVALIRPALDAWLANYSQGNPIELIEDEQIGSPGLILESSDGRIDMQLQSQLERLQQELG